jgi:phage tail-like protein
MALTLGIAVAFGSSGAGVCSAWPMSNFYFLVKGLPSDASFQEVTGLPSDTKPIQYRKPDAKGFPPIKMPGLGKVGNVTLRKGIFVNGRQLWDWFNQIKMSSIKRRTITITLLDDQGTPKRTWRLQNAFPTKVTGTDLKSVGNEVAVESIEIAYETLTVSAP